MKNYISILLTWMFEKISFSQRVINHWNALTQHAVDCNTVNSFKRRVDHYIRDKDIDKLLLFFPFWSRLPSRSRGLLS